VRYVVDTNIFNRIADGMLTRANLPSSAELVATHVQTDEINKTSDSERRGQLFLIFAKVAPEIVPTESAVWGANRSGDAKWSDGALFQSLKSALDNRRAKPNNVQDAQILEVAVVKGFGLITADGFLAEVAKEHNVSVQFIAP
jgi:hypothetical protein